MKRFFVEKRNLN